MEDATETISTPGIEMAGPLKNTETVTMSQLTSGVDPQSFMLSEENTASNYRVNLSKTHKLMPCMLTILPKMDSNSKRVVAEKQDSTIESDIIVPNMTICANPSTPDEIFNKVGTCLPLNLNDKKYLTTKKKKKKKTRVSL